MGTAMLTIMVAFAQLERDTMIERTRAGRADSHIRPATIRKAHRGEVDLLSDRFARRVVADTERRFDSSVPDDDVHRFVNDLERSIAIYRYGAPAV